MNLKVSKRVKPGAIVRESWDTLAAYRGHGLVLTIERVQERHEAKCLGGMKDERYDLTVHWFNGPRWPMGKNPEVMQNWEVMLVSAT